MVKRSEFKTKVKEDLKRLTQLALPHKVPMMVMRLNGSCFFYAKNKVGRLS